jgi:hypothetical protein
LLLTAVVRCPTKPSVAAVVLAGGVSGSRRAPAAAVFDAAGRAALPAEVRELVTTRLQASGGEDPGLSATAGVMDCPSVHA